MLVANLRDNVKLMMKKIREKVWPHVVFYAALHGLSYNHHVFFAEARYIYQNDTFQPPIMLIPYLKLKCWKIY